MIDMSNNKILSDDEIVDIIIKYVDENLYNYAVMIDGDWGCGKTNFVKEYLYGKLEAHEKGKVESEKDYKERRIVYISLYGIKSVEEISKHVLLESYLVKTGKAKGFFKKSTEVVGSMLPAIFDIIKPFTGLELDSDKMEKAIGGFFSIKNTILIFDDLERCDCPINEILGYINGFVEHEGMKVILVANQKEIGKSTYLKNQELKYLVAANENITFEQVDKNEKIRNYYNLGSKKEEKVKEPVDINTIEARMDKLFGQDLLYEKVREKLIGITIHYYPDLSSIFVKLIKNDCININLQEYLLEEVPFFEEYMKWEEHPNLRTFQFYLSKISNLYDVIRNIESEGQEAFIKFVIGYAFKVCVCYKNGTFEYEWEGMEEYEFKSIGKNDIFGTNLSLRFVDDYVLKSVLEEERVKKMLLVYEDEYIKKNEEELETLKKLEYGWYLSTDEEIENNLEEIMQALEENKYEINVYERLISLLIDLEQVGFPKENMNMAILKMKNNIKKLSYHMYLDSGYCSGSNEEKKVRYREIVQELQSEIDKRFKKQVVENIEQYISEDDGWAEHLIEYVRKNKQEIRDKNGFLSQMDIEVLIKKIEVSAAYDIHAFRACILELYVNKPIGGGLALEKEIVDELLMKLEEIDKGKFDRIKKMQLEYLSENLKKAQEHLAEWSGK